MVLLPVVLEAEEQLEDAPRSVNGEQHVTPAPHRGKDQVRKILLTFLLLVLPNSVGVSRILPIEGSADRGGVEGAVCVESGVHRMLRGVQRMLVESMVVYSAERPYKGENNGGHFDAGIRVRAAHNNHWCSQIRAGARMNLAHASIYTAMIRKSQSNGIAISHSKSQIAQHRRITDTLP